MLKSFLYLRVNLAIMLLGAFAIIFLIKLTSLLPAQFYFSFSHLVAGERGPFLVDPPSVTGRKLCELLVKHRISTEQLELGQINCKVDATQNEPVGLAPGSVFSKQAIDQIYATALRTDPGIRTAISGAIPGLNITPMDDAALEKMLSEVQSLNGAYGKLVSYYDGQLGQFVGQPIRQNINELYESIPVKSAGAPEPTARPDLPPLTEPQKATIRQLNQSIAGNLARDLAALQLKEISKSDVDKIIKTAYGTWAISNGVASHYLNQLSGKLKSDLKDDFDAGGLKLVSKQEARRKMFSELSEAGIRDYILAVLIRLAPVIIFSVVLGFVFGRPEFMSISMAAALAAFLLSWPLMLMWDRLVEGNWADQKPLFMIFYGVYILSFFVTARFGAVLGALVRTKIVGRRKVIVDTHPGGFIPEAVTWNELAINFVTGVIVNAAVYAWNVIIPMTVA